MQKIKCTAYAAIRSSTTDVDLFTYDHLPFTRDVHKERRVFAEMMAKLQKEINNEKNNTTMCPLTPALSQTQCQCG